MLIIFIQVPQTEESTNKGRPGTAIKEVRTNKRLASMKTTTRTKTKMKGADQDEDEELKMK